MSKTALVLNGGSARGAFQVGAVKYLRETHGFKPDIYTGESVGALNVAMLAAGKHAELEMIWSTLTNRMVYSGGKDAGLEDIDAPGQIRALNSNTPLKMMIDTYIDPAAIKDMDLRVIAVSLMTGDTKVYRPSNPGFREALLASTAIPLVFPPVDVSSTDMAMVDGALSSYTPLDAALESDPDRVIVINCSPTRLHQLTSRPKTMMRIGERTFEIAAHQFLHQSIERLRDRNWDARQHAIHGHRNAVDRHGRPMREVELIAIEPDEVIGDGLDFSHEMIRRRFDAGWQKAREIFG